MKANQSKFETLNINFVPLHTYFNKTKIFSDMDINLYYIVLLFHFPATCVVLECLKKGGITFIRDIIRRLELINGFSHVVLTR